jgi:hypothetical protein
MPCLLKEFELHGNKFTLLKAAGALHLYEARCGTEIAYWEVVIARNNADTSIKGNLIRGGWAMPGSSQWGKSGWTFYNLPAAEDRFQLLSAIGWETYRAAAEKNPELWGCPDPVYEKA